MRKTFYELLALIMTGLIICGPIGFVMFGPSDALEIVLMTLIGLLLGWALFGLGYIIYDYIMEVFWEKFL